MGKERVIYASGEFRWFRQVHSKKTTLLTLFLISSLWSQPHEFYYFCFILLDILPSGDSLYIYRQINLFFNKILNVLGLWDSFGSCE